MSGCPVAGSGLRARVNAKKSSGVRAKKTGSDSATMSVRRAVLEVQLDRHAAALRRVVRDAGVSAAVREAHGGAHRIPVHVRGARKRAAAGVAVNVPAQSVPFACAARWPGWTPVKSLIESTTCFGGWARASRRP